MAHVYMPLPGSSDSDVILNPARLNMHLTFAHCERPYWLPTGLTSCALTSVLLSPLIDVTLASGRNLTSNSSLRDRIRPNSSADALPKSPNFVTRDAFYGTGPSAQSCSDLAEDLFPGPRRVVYFSQCKQPAGLPVYKAPLFLDDPGGKKLWCEHIFWLSERLSHAASGNSSTKKASRLHFDH